jgi:hypothetical protein
MGIDSDWYVNKAIHVRTHMHAQGLKATNTTSWGLSLNGRTVNGHGGVSILDDTNRYGIHITAAEVYFIRNNTYFSLGDVLRGAT